MVNEGLAPSLEQDAGRRDVVAQLKQVCWLLIFYDLVIGFVGKGFIFVRKSVNLCVGV